MAERRRRPALALLVAASVLAALGAPAEARTQRTAAMGSDPYRPGEVYRGDFPDPTVWRVGGRFYAASTTVAALNLPTTTSTDLHTWTALPDALPKPARWAQQRYAGNGRAWAPSWAPSVARVVSATGVTTFVAAYAVPRASDGRRCLSLARSRSAAGPYVDSSQGPLLCGPQGTIDPQLFVDDGAVWLLMKSAGSRSRLLVRRMTSSAAAFATGSRAYMLVAPEYPWEGSVVENPAMTRYRGSLYLFYSANNFTTARYATGYAVCRTVLGPCLKRGRILYSGSSLAGPGGATPFVDTAGRLRLAYHAWRTGNVGYPADDACLQSAAGCAQRRLYVATLAPARGGLVRVSWS